MRCHLLCALCFALQITASTSDNTRPTNSQTGNEEARVSLEDVSIHTTQQASSRSTASLTALPSTTISASSSSGTVSTVQNVVQSHSQVVLSTRLKDRLTTYEKKDGAHSGVATCRNRQINYITHGLPKLCLKSTEGRLWTEVVSTTTHVTTETGKVAAETTSVVIGSTPPSSNPVSSTSKAKEEIHSAASTIPTSVPIIGSTEEDDLDSPLNTARFLSFEEWRKQNLEKAGQLLEHVGHGRAKADPARQRPDISNLDAIGAEGELDFDFAGFGGAGLGTGSQAAPAAREVQNDPKGSGADTAHPLRSKDAGKTCKERYNYASFDCAATVLKTNARCKSATSVLVESKDSYMLNECGVANKFIIIELCDDILVDTIVLANFEFFSSMVRTFRVSISDRYPPRPNQWSDLGTFEARNTREIQAFLVEGARVWARYVRIEFLTHYGNEFYCPLSLIRVHGITMMEEYKHEEEQARRLAEGVLLEGEEDFREAHQQGIEAVAEGKVVSAEVLLQEERQKSSAAAETTSLSPATVDSSNTSSSEASTTSVPPENKSRPSDLASPSSSAVEGRPHQQATETMRAESSATTSTTKQATDVPSSSSSPADPSKPSPTLSAQSRSSSNSTSSSHRSDESASSSGSEARRASLADATDRVGTAHGAKRSVESSSSSVSSNSTTLQNKPEYTKERTVESISSSKSNSKSGSNSSTVVVPGTSVAVIESRSNKPSTASTASLVQPPQPSPSTQDSFFKSIHTRLRNLELNATLSLQYVEAQAAQLRDAFQAVEKRQLSKTMAFLNHLNSSVVEELKAYRRMYDELWQSTVIELESQRETWEKEVRRLGDGMGKLESEIIWLRGMGVVQMGLLVLCLAFVIFGVKSDGPSAGSDMSNLLKRTFSVKHGQRRFNGHLHNSSIEGMDSPEQEGGRESAKRSRSKLSFRRFLKGGGGSRHSQQSSPGQSSTSPEQAFARPLKMGADVVAFQVSPPTPESPSPPPTRGSMTSCTEDELHERASGMGFGRLVGAVEVSDEREGDELEEGRFLSDDGGTDGEERVRQTYSSPSTPLGTRDGAAGWMGMDGETHLRAGESGSESASLVSDGIGDARS